MHKNTSDIFCLSKTEMDGQQIFSIGGSPSFRINRRRQVTSNVFPFGCMGTVQDTPDLPASASSSADTVDAEEDVAKETENIADLPEPTDEATFKKPKQRIAQPYQGLSARNPLTGEGIELPNPNKGRKGSIRRTTLSKWNW